MTVFVVLIQINAINDGKERSDGERYLLSLILGAFMTKKSHYDTVYVYIELPSAHTSFQR